MTAGNVTHTARDVIATCLHNAWSSAKMTPEEHDCGDCIEDTDAFLANLAAAGYQVVPIIHQLENRDES